MTLEEEAIEKRRMGDCFPALSFGKE